MGYCPGLAIFIIDEAYSKTEAIIRIPWEFLPLPAKGSQVVGLNREGQEITQVTIKKVQPSPRKNEAHILWLVVPKEFAHEVRSIVV